ncbi:MAG: hypothetical protein EHM28_06600 [Spirochaetaceae bacterium]|nr:MAG: hypothetical protein EHM28_06600 [Spirochaetaceae bacterium]
MKILRRLSILAVLGIVLMLLGSCDSFITLTIYVENNTGDGSIIDAYITWDGGSTGTQNNILDGNYGVFNVNFYNSDNYGEITVHVSEDGGSWRRQTGNVAENDWVTTIHYPYGFWYY